MKDDLSEYAWLHKCCTADRNEAINAMARWIATFELVQWVVLDEGSHSIASLVKNLTQEADIGHHFMAAYFSCSNETIEHLCEEIMRPGRALLCKWGILALEWPAVVDCVQRFLNQFSFRRLRQNDHGYLTPIEVFIGMNPTPMMNRPCLLLRFEHMGSLTEKMERALVNIKTLQQRMSKMHMEVDMRNERSRVQTRVLHSARTNVVLINFTIGDFRLRLRTNRLHKLKTLYGPMRAKHSVARSAVEIENRLQTKKKVDDAQRLVYWYAMRTHWCTSEELFEEAKHRQNSYHVIKNILEIGETNGEFELLVD